MRRGQHHLIGLVAFLWLVGPSRGTTDEPNEGFRPELVDVEFTAREVRPGDPFSITLKFRNSGDRPADRAYRVFTHFEAPRKSCEDIVIHADHAASEPTTLWRPGQIVVDGPLILHAPSDAVERDYFVHVGLYDYGGTGRRVLDTYAAGKIRVTSAAPAAADMRPRPLPPSEVKKRRREMATRIEATNRVSVETQVWRFDADRTTGAWCLLDKKTDARWTSDPIRPWFGRITLRKGDRLAVWRINRFDELVAAETELRLVTRPIVDDETTGVSVTFKVQATPESAELQIAYDTHTSGGWQVVSIRLLENALTVTEEDGGCFYVPYRLGIELPANRGLPGNRVWTPYNNLSMAMCGAVKQGSALLVSWQQVDSRLTVHTTWPNAPLVAGRQARSLSLELDGAANACTIQPLGRGGYVEIAKAYRSLAAAKGWRKTWVQKRAQSPTVDRLFGAANFKPFVFSRILPSSRFSLDGREHARVGFVFDEVARCAEHWRNDLEIDRAYVVLAGWINGGYDVRHPDVLPVAPECGGNAGLKTAAARIKACGYLFGLHDNYQDMYQDAPSWGEHWLNKDDQGVSRKGGNWNGGQAWQVCAIKQFELAARKQTNLPAIAKLFQPTIYFIDTVFAWPLVTCEDPNHPMCRLDDLTWKTNLCLLAREHFGLFGSEEGREWAVPCADYLEGIFSHQTDSPPGDVIPLFPLVYSDCVQIMTHQGNRIAAGNEKKVADHILFAEMFLPSFGTHVYWDQPEIQRIPIVPLEPMVKDSGTGRLAITYRWKVLKPLTEDLNVFVHFTSERAERPENIAFQNDHRPTTPTSRWLPGEIVLDGPYTVEIPSNFAGPARVNVGMLRGQQRVALAKSSRQRQRYTVGEIVVSKGTIHYRSPKDVPELRFWDRGDNGWGEQLCRTDRVIKNVWEVLSPLNRITAEMPMNDHQFITPDRLVQQTRFGDVTITVAYAKPARIGNHKVPAHGFLVDSPRFIAFCATRYNGVDYESPTLFTAQSLDGKPIRESGEVRIYHGFGGQRIRLFDKEFDVAREEVVSLTQD